MDQNQSVRDIVRQGYAAIAESGAAGCCAPSCCGGGGEDSATALAQAVGYDAAELNALPEGANMGLSCGNPTALASLAPGEVVLDLGSGGGFDVFIAGRKVGPDGRAIGVDMTPEMLGKARKNAQSYRERTGFDNVEFRLGEIEHLPVPDNSVDVVISNCVINLSPDKPQVWREIARVLKPGGRVAVSDLALRQALPPAIQEMVEALVGCIAGAVTIAENETMAQAAGLESVTLSEKPGFIEAMTEVNDPLYAQVVAALPEGTSAADFIVSLDIAARKPGAAQINGESR
jgi:arsenite methyltransferase